MEQLPVNSFLQRCLYQQGLVHSSELTASSPDFSYYIIGADVVGSLKLWKSFRFDSLPISCTKQLIQQLLSSLALHKYDDLIGRIVEIDATIIEGLLCKGKILGEDGYFWIILVFLLGLDKISRKRFFFVDIKSQRIYMRIVTVGKKVRIATVYSQVLDNPHVCCRLHRTQEQLPV